jgi:flagellar biosynthesis protein FliQ
MQEILIEHLKQGILLGLILSMPAVLTAAAVGLVVGILQAVTQVQEQTIAAAPKIALVFLVIILGGPLMLDLMSAYVRECAVLAFDEIPKSGDKRILPPAPPRKRVSAPSQPDNLYGPVP